MKQNVPRYMHLVHVPFLNDISCAMVQMSFYLDCMYPSSVYVTHALLLFNVHILLLHIVHVLFFVFACSICTPILLSGIKMI